jgi:hypothetical protein
MRKYQVLDRVVRVTRPRDEVVDLDGVVHRRPAVEAPIDLELSQPIDQHRRRAAWLTEQERVKSAVVHGAAIECRDQVGPLPFDERAQECGQPHEMVADAGAQPEREVVGVTGEVGAADVGRPVDVVDEGVVAGAELLQPRQRHLDQLPLDLADQCLEAVGVGDPRLPDGRGRPRAEPLPEGAASSSRMARPGRCEHGCHHARRSIRDSHGRRPSASSAVHARSITQPARRMTSSRSSAFQ